jgi:predicted ATP-binding protein involved in virulence
MGVAMVSPSIEDKAATDDATHLLVLAHVVSALHWCAQQLVSGEDLKIGQVTGHHLLAITHRCLIYISQDSDSYRKIFKSTE